METWIEEGQTEDRWFRNGERMAKATAARGTSARHRWERRIGFESHAEGLVHVGEWVEGPWRDPRWTLGKKGGALIRMAFAPYLC